MTVKNNLTTLGSVVRTARRDQNLTLDALHEKVGYSVSYLHKVETDKVKNPSSEFLSALGRELEIDPLDLAELVVTRESTENRTSNNGEHRQSEAELPHIGQGARSVGVERLLNRSTLPVNVQALQGGFLTQGLFDLLGRDYLRGEPSFQSLSIIEGLMALAKSHADLGVELFGFSGTDEQERQTYYDALTCYKTAYEISRSLHSILKNAEIVHIARKVRASLTQNRYRMARVFQELAFLSSTGDRRYFDAHDRVGYLYQALDLCEDGMRDIAEARDNEDLTWEEKCTEPALLAISAMLLKGIRLLLPVAPDQNHGFDEQGASATPPQPLMEATIDLDRQKAETLDGFILKRRDAAATLYDSLIQELIERNTTGKNLSQETNERLAEAYHRLAFLFRAVDDNDAASLDEIIKKCTGFFRSAIEYRRRILTDVKPKEGGEDPLTEELHMKHARKHLARYHRELGYTLSTFLSKRRLKSAIDAEYKLTALDEANVYAEILWQYRVSSRILPQYAPRNEEHRQEALNTLRSLNEKLYSTANQQVKDTEKESDFVALEYPLLLKDSRGWHKMRRKPAPPT